MVDTNPISNTDRSRIKDEKGAAKTQAKAQRAEQKAKAKAEKQHIKSLAQIAENKLLSELKASLATHARSATFACGGTVLFKAAVKKKELSNDESLKKDSANMQEIDPIDIRFGENEKGVTLTLSGNSSTSKELEALISACQPATFGRGSEEVLHEAYRKAGKLDKTAFTTSFCPYEAGIIDVVAQLLLPQTSQNKNMRSIRAELYKLNVYSAPSGKFKAHVDTPRSEAQVASLVVTLPVDHEGGALSVRHGGREMVFDWSESIDETENDVDKSMSGIKWAAFYSDCEHEVHEVTRGHPVTLTYNLYATRGLGHLVGIPTPLDTTQLPFYETLCSALHTPRFLRHGRVLGVWLTHSYAHTNKHINFLPSSLKGADMSLYETAGALGLKCALVPVINVDWGWDGEGPRHLLNGKFCEFNEGLGDAPEGEEGDPDWGTEMPEDKVRWINRNDEFEEVQTAYMTYGNEPRIGIYYSKAAMLIRIPAFKHRQTSGEKLSKSIWAGVRSDYNDDDYDYDDSSEDSEDDSEEMESENDTMEVDESTQ